jgi:hypothetical protein
MKDSEFSQKILKVQDDTIFRLNCGAFEKIMVQLY